jgi:hypothetical protein
MVKTWVLVGLVLLLTVVAIDFGQTMSSLHVYNGVRLGMSSTEVLKTLNDGHTYCGSLPLQKPDPRTCVFGDPWRIYILTFDDGGTLIHKRFAFRRDQALFVRALFG